LKEMTRSPGIHQGGFSSNALQSNNLPFYEDKYQ
jgi:hypothetical protein